MFTCAPALLAASSAVSTPVNVTQAPVYAIVKPAPQACITQAPVYAIVKPAAQACITQAPVYAIVTL